MVSSFQPKFWAENIAGLTVCCTQCCGVLLSLNCHSGPCFCVVIFTYFCRECSKDENLGFVNRRQPRERLYAVSQVWTGLKEKPQSAKQQESSNEETSITVSTESLAEVPAWQTRFYCDLFSLFVSFNHQYCHVVTSLMPNKCDSYLCYVLSVLKFQNLVSLHSTFQIHQQSTDNYLNPNNETSDWCKLLVACYYITGYLINSSACFFWNLIPMKINTN